MKQRRLLVPTVDTQRNKFVVGALVRGGHHALVVGGVGVGKTLTLQSLLEALPADRAHCTINFSAQTSSASLQVRPPGIWGSAHQLGGAMCRSIPHDRLDNAQHSLNVWCTLIELLEIYFLQFCLQSRG
jgi:hypothetical protein